ncbi:hypothetical protein VUR80DRAFT_6407 [Thermomyces stellatus]
MCDMLVQLLFSDKASDVPDSERLAPPQIRDTAGIKTVTNHGLESLFLPTGSAPQGDLVRFSLPSLHFSPRPSGNVQFWKDHEFALEHLIRALFMVVNDQVAPERLTSDMEPREADHLNVDD